MAVVVEAVGRKQLGMELFGGLNDKQCCNKILPKQGRSQEKI